MPNSYYGREDKNLKDALLAEEQRIQLLSLLVHEAASYYREGLVVPQKVESEAQQVRKHNNPTYQWIGERIVEKPGHTELLDDWYQDYCKWCSEWGFSPQVKGRFARTLYETGYHTNEAFGQDQDTGKRRRLTEVTNGRLDE